MGGSGGGERELFAFTSFAFLIKREKYSKPFAIVSAIFKFNLHNIPNRRRASAHPSPCCKFFRLLTIVLFASAAAAAVVVTVSVSVVVALVADTIQVAALSSLIGWQCEKGSRSALPRRKVTLGCTCSQLQLLEGGEKAFAVTLHSS